MQFGFETYPLLGGYGRCCGVILIEYWLLGWGSSCPSGWTSEPGNNCTIKSSTASTGLEWTRYLTAYTFSGFYSGSTDTVEFCDANKGQCYMQSNTDLVGLSNGNWDQSEWNVFGYGNGSGACFNSGVTNGKCNSGGGSISLTITASAPSITGSCSSHSDFPKEYNYLNLVSGSCSGSGNSISFSET